MSKIAIIGFGNIVKNNHVAALQSVGAEIVAICDIDESARDSARKIFGYSIEFYTDYEVMISEKSLDYVLVTLPHNLYYEVVKKCLEKNINVIKEKPFAMNYDDAINLSEIALKSKSKLLTVCQKRYNPAYSELKKLIDINTDDIKQINIRYTIPSKKPNSGWRSEHLQAGGGVWMDMGYHLIDLINYLFNNSDVNLAFTSLINTSPENYDVDDCAYVFLRCMNININIYISCVDVNKSEEITVIGSKFIALATSKSLTMKNKKQEVLYDIKFENSDTMSFENMYRSFLSDSTDDKFHLRQIKNAVSTTNLIQKVSLLSTVLN